MLVKGTKQSVHKRRITHLTYLNDVQIEYVQKNLTIIPTNLWMYKGPWDLKKKKSEILLSVGLGGVPMTLNS